MAVMVGAVLGFLSGLGIGGGSLLMLYLTLAVGMSQPEARGINLLFYLPCAGMAAAMRQKDGTVNRKRIRPAIAAGCVTAAVLGQFGAGADAGILRTCFGGLLVVTGLREVFYKKKEKMSS